MNEIYSSIFNITKTLTENTRYDFAFVWNGQRIFQRAFADAVISEGVKIKFFEITNLPGKIQVDDKGVNAQSSFLSRLINCEGRSNKQDWIDWKRNFQDTADKKIVGQVTLLKKINLYYLLDYIGVLLLGCLEVEKNSFFKKLIKKINYKKQMIPNEGIPEGYIFFPLQVSSDSQVLINYHGDLFSALDEALVIAKTHKLTLVIKPHPAETDLALLKILLDKKSRHNFIISNSNTIDLIKSAKKIITINSTVGLEALLLEKEVYFLGESIYKNISEAEMANLILDIFIDVDYFSKKQFLIGDVLNNE
nr:hypothetical protein [Salinisphaera sp. G21_0]